MKRNKRAQTFLFSLFLGLLCSTFAEQVSANAGLSADPTSVNFGSLPVNTLSSPQVITLTNIGNQSITIQQAASSIPQFAVSGLALPATLAPGQGASFLVVFVADAVGTFSGSINFSLNRTSAGLRMVPVSGTGLATTQPTPAQTYQLSASPSSLSFASAIVGSTSASQNVTVSNTGNSTVTISQLSFSGTSFSATGLSLPLNLAAGQSASFSVLFAPLTTGTLSGSLSVVSTATNSPTSIALSGSSTQAISVDLSWSDTSTTLAGFNVYRSATTGGPYAKITSSLVPSASYVDTSVQSGSTYYYVTTAVDPTGAESSYSNETTVAIP